MVSQTSWLLAGVHSCFKSYCSEAKRKQMTFPGSLPTLLQTEREREEERDRERKKEVERETKRGIERERERERERKNKGEGKMGTTELDNWQLKTDLHESDGAPSPVLGLQLCSS